MNNELYHHGILGMKWGVRRYQNKDGSYTTEGKKHYSQTTGDFRKETQRAKREAQRHEKEKKEKIQKIIKTAISAVGAVKVADLLMEMHGVNTRALKYNFVQAVVTKARNVAYDFRHPWHKNPDGMQWRVE